MSCEASVSLNDPQVVSCDGLASVTEADLVSDAPANSKTATIHGCDDRGQLVRSISCYDLASSRVISSSLSVFGPILEAVGSTRLNESRVSSIVNSVSGS